MAHSKGIKTSQLPLRHTDLYGRIELLREQGLIEGEVKDGFLLMGNKTLLEISQTMKPPVENVIGAIPYQLGLATNFMINEKEMLVPMAVREPTVIAAASHGAKKTLPFGFSTSSAFFNEITAQIMFSGFEQDRDAHECKIMLRDCMRVIMEDSRFSNNERGNLLSWKTELLADDNPLKRPLVVVNFKVDVGDYMGAMRANKIARAVAERLQEGVGREPTSYICSNHLAGRQVIAQAYVPWSAISTKTGNAIQGMQQWADMDVYRSTTHIKGILNGIMGVCRATGQDEEAVMAAILSQIVKSPEKTFTKYHYSSDGLRCQLSMKLPVATEGGATQDTFARMCLALMGVSSVDDLLPIAACAGLATNISALRCLPEEGIIEAFKAVEED